MTPRCKNNAITFVPKICHGHEKKRDTGKRKYWFESQSDTPFPTQGSVDALLSKLDHSTRKSMYKNLSTGNLRYQQARN